MKFDSKCHLSTKKFAEHSKIASQPINWKVNKCHFVVLVVNKCHFVVLVVNKCHFVVLVVNKCHFVVLVVNKCHFVVLVVRKRSRNDFTLLKRVLKLCNNVANYGTKFILLLCISFENETIKGFAQHCDIMWKLHGWFGSPIPLIICCFLSSMREIVHGFIVVAAAAAKLYRPI